MNKLKKFINVEKVKDFFFDHGEKVGLGTCLLIALLFAVLGLMRTTDAGREEKSGLTWVELFAKEYERITNGIDARKADVPPPTVFDGLNPDFYKWDPRDWKFQQAQLTQPSEEHSGKRENPQVLAVKPVGKNTIHLEYWKGLIFSYEQGLASVDSRTVKAVKCLEPPPGAPPRPPVAGLPQPPLRLAKPSRVVVGTMIFPMKQQLAEFVRALRMKNQAELLASKDDLPKPLGFTLVRNEVVNGNPVGKEVVLVLYDPTTNAVKMSAALKGFLRDVMIDEQFPDALEPYIWSGLVMPTPQVAQGTFSKFDLEGIAVDWAKLQQPNKKGGIPGVEDPMKRPKDPLLKIKKPPVKIEKGQTENVIPDGKLVDGPEKQLKPANPDLAARLFDGKFNVLHPLGQLAPIVEKGVPFPPQGAGLKRFTAAWEVKGPVPMDDDKPMQPVVVPPRVGDAPAVPDGPDWDRDAIVRFIDPDVEPGRTYEYSIQVYLANPNFKKDALVQFNQLAEKSFLKESPWTKTPTITIPHEYSLYAADQLQLDDWANAIVRPGAFDPKFFRDVTTFQIHQWIKKRDDLAGNEFLVGDWAIAERVYVRRGDSIGVGAEVKVPVWRKLKDGFDVPRAIEIRDAKKTLVGKAYGIKFDMAPLTPDGDNLKNQPTPPVLIDFHGGKKFKGTQVEEETAVDALVMRADGVLEVLNSRTHSEDLERQRRLEESRRRVEAIIGPQP